MISNELKKNTFLHFENFKMKEFVVKPSFPILYFGDLVRYRDSHLKIVTVGKNPSLNEFRLKEDEDFSFVRFPKWNEKIKNLEEVLNAYFETKPLKKWFSSFEPILNGMNASYYKGNWTNTAIHTDICSPLATSPTWSLINKSDKEMLFKEGYLLWKQLIHELEPDVILVSIPKQLFASIFNSVGKEIIVFDTMKNGDIRKYPYQVFQHEYQIQTKNIKIIFGQAANKPFDKISNFQKYSIGEKCLK
jgi:hypothetical protein